MTVTQAFDGAHAWMNNPQAGGIQDLPADRREAFARNALGHSAWLDPQKHGITYSLGGSALDEPGYYALIQTFSSGHSNLFLVDEVTFLVFMMRTKTVGPSGAEIESELTMSDYRSVGSTVYPHKMVDRRGGEKFSTLLLDEIKINTGVEDSVFSAPSEQSASVNK
ncbi:MAG: hypothetical protein GY906_19015 [bacterium]|nr:hypothetical protein [bacterium]